VKEELHNERVNVKIKNEENKGEKKWKHGFRESWRILDI
jgi:hypothetical protein